MSSNQFVGLSFPSSSTSSVNNSNNNNTPSIHSFYQKSTSSGSTALTNPSNTTFLELDVCSLAKMYQQPQKQSRLNQLIGNYP